jgi:hypothetical protein
VVIANALTDSDYSPHVGFQEVIGSSWITGKPSNNPTCQRWPVIFWPGYTAGGGVPRVAPSK